MTDFNELFRVDPDLRDAALKTAIQNKWVQHLPIFKKLDRSILGEGAVRALIQNANGPDCYTVTRDVTSIGFYFGWAPSWVIGLRLPSWVSPSIRLTLASRLGEAAAYHFNVLGCRRQLLSNTSILGSINDEITSRRAIEYLRNFDLERVHALGGPGLQEVVLDFIGIEPMLFGSATCERTQQDRLQFTTLSDPLRKQVVFTPAQSDIVGTLSPDFLPTARGDYKLGSEEGRYKDLLEKLGVNGHEGAVAEIARLRQLAGLS